MTTRNRGYTTLSHLATYTVAYDSSSHWSVITQRWGSLWPLVFPYCLLNVTIMISIYLVKEYVFDVSRIKIDSTGLVFTTKIMAFLMVARVNNSLNRSNKARDCLTVMDRESRDFVQYVCVFSSGNTDCAAQEWRHEVAYRCLILLRTCMAVIDYDSNKIAAWKIPELNGMEKDDIMGILFSAVSPESERASTHVRRWAHGNHDEWEDSLRVPVRLSYLLKKSVHTQKERLTQDPIPWLFESKLLSCVDKFMAGYYDMRKQLTTPIPFPLVQMSRTFVFLYVFVVPFVLVGDISSLFAHCITVFVITFGFLGLEICAIGLDDPFGNDENDFDNAAAAMVAYEDIYLTIRGLDGPDYADMLRKRMWAGDTSMPEVPGDNIWLNSKVA